MTTPARIDTELRVRYGETDQMGIVYHPVYLMWCEIGRTEYMRQLGMPYASLEARGTLLAVADASLRYHAPARYDDMIRIETILSDVRSRALTFDYTIVNAATGARLVSARTLLIAIDRASRPVLIPADVRQLLQSAQRGERGATVS
jgi:acyl-CoA thioester hydrolase